MLLSLLHRGMGSKSDPYTRTRSWICIAADLFSTNSQCRECGKEYYGLCHSALSSSGRVEINAADLAKGGPSQGPWSPRGLAKVFPPNHVGFENRFGTPALRITDKTFNSLQITGLPGSHVSLFCHSFPFSPACSLAVRFFLATYWPLGKIGSLEVAIVSG